MNRVDRWVRWLWVMALLLMLVTPPVFAMSSAGSYADGALRKLGRGVANVVTCPGELIRTSQLVGQRDGYISALTVGVAQGAWRTLLRGVTGVFEVVTFYAEIPKGFEPIMKPEFVWAHGDWVE